MNRAGKYKNALERFVSSEKGQRFFNFAYSIGAAIVIWGALYKILHIRGGDVLLAIGMGTEVLMFILTAFDRPPREYDWEKAFPELADGKPVAPRNPEPEQNVEVPVNSTVTEVPDADALAGEIETLKKNLSENSEGYREQMQTLNRNLSNLNAIYENTLSQSTRYCEESEKMARNMQQLNRIYDNMLRAMSVNMNNGQRPAASQMTETEE